jgi:hypothetical protein
MNLFLTTKELVDLGMVFGRGEDQSISRSGGRIYWQLNQTPTQLLILYQQNSKGPRSICFFFMLELFDFEKA